MSRMSRLENWLIGQWQWPQATLFAACFLLAVAPLWFQFAGVSLGMIFLQLPLYMVHQWEEHADDRFRAYANRVIGGGQEILTRVMTFWINFAGVWIVNLVALYLASYVELSIGLIAVYLTVVNGIFHLIGGMVRREYNPGLITSAFLFLPVGGWSWYEVSVASHAPLRSHAIMLAILVGGHAMIGVPLLLRRRLAAQQPS